jgi:hypothetical protein
LRGESGFHDGGRIFPLFRRYARNTGFRAHAGLSPVIS